MHSEERQVSLYNEILSLLSTLNAKTTNNNIVTCNINIKVSTCGSNVCLIVFFKCSPYVFRFVFVPEEGQILL